MIEVSSPSNDHFKRWKDLDSARGIRKHGEFFLMGEKLIAEFLENPNFKIKAEIMGPDHTSILAAFPSVTREQKISTFRLSGTLFNEIDFLGTHFNLLVLEPKEIPELGSSAAQGLELVCPLGDPSNLGALIRSGLAFGASKMILTKESASPYLPKAVKASAGAVLKLPFVRTAASLHEFAGAHRDLYALDMNGDTIENFRWPRHLRLLVGEEGPGLAELDIANRLRISTGRVESLNATVAASIALFCYAQNIARE